MELGTAAVGSFGMKPVVVMPFLLCLSALAFAAAPFFTPFNGFDPSAYPAPQNNPPVQPAGYAFAIWGLIYIWLILSTLVGATLRRNDEGWAPHRLPLFISLVIGTSWLWVAGQSPIAATVLIWLMLIAALVALFRTPMRERFLLRAPVGLYAGWLTAASWVSVGLLGAGYEIGFQEFGWAILCIFAAFITAFVIILRVRSAIAYMGGVTWALIAVAVKTAQSTPTVALLSGLGAMALGLLTLWSKPARSHSR